MRNCAGLLTIPPRVMLKDEIDERRPRVFGKGAMIMAATQSSMEPTQAAAERIRVTPFWARALAVYAALFLMLFLIQQVSFSAARVPVTLTLSSTGLTVSADGQSLALRLSTAPSQVTFASSSLLDREFQIDGTDSTNNFTEDAAYVISIVDTPYYRFQDWMRDADSYSSWRDLTLRDATTGRTLAQSQSVSSSQSLALPPGRPVNISVALQRPEAPVQILFVCEQNPCVRISFDRNDRFIRAETFLPNGTLASEQQHYFPQQPLPFLAEVIYLLAHVALWSLVLFGVLALLHVTVLLCAEYLSRHMPIFPASTPEPLSALVVRRARLPRIVRGRDRWDVLSALIVMTSFLFTCFIALVQYHAQPHILDASAYYFQAKIFASGRLAAPAPADVAAFQGPFMVVQNGRWFAQYPPATSALIALGLLFRAPWVIEPLLGALALWGIYRMGCRLFSRPVACLAVFLGALSAFYSYLAASYLSHAVAFFFAVYFMLWLLRFAESRRARDLSVAAACWGGLLLTRELSALIIGTIATAFVFIVYRRTLLRDKLQFATAALAALGVALLAITLYLLYNRSQTGDALTLPRTLFSPADRYGFGPGIGFYGQHTLAAGFVILDQLLTILQIDLFGWPFYLTLAFIPLAFLNRSVRHTWDWLCLLLFAALTLAQAGYFYHGIYLGPRYLYETLPFVLLLTARGIVSVAGWLVGFGRRPPLRAPVTRVRLSSRLLVGLAVSALIACNLLYYLPRQLTLHANFTGLPAVERVDVAALYDFHPSHALIITNDWYFYNYILWPLNDATLTGSTLYAYAPSPADVARLQSEYPDRMVYSVTVAPNGQVTFPLARP